MKQCGRRSDGILEVLKRKPDIDLVMVKRLYKSMGRVFKCKSRAVFVPRVVRGQFATCSVTNGRMQETTGEHSKDITAVLQALVRDGMLTQQNQRRWASYRVAEDSPNCQTTPLIWSRAPPNCRPTPPNWPERSDFLRSFRPGKAHWNCAIPMIATGRTRRIALCPKR